MKRVMLLLVAAIAIAAFCLPMNGCDKARPTSPIDGNRAYAWVKGMVDIGPSPAGTMELKACRDYILGELKKLGLTAKVDSFKSEPHGAGIEFHNIECEIPATNADEKRLLVLGSHYDTKRTHVPGNPNPEMLFVGANDAGSSSGLLIELARHFKANPLPCRLLLTWFDGEESLPWEWDSDKALFGSRRCVQQLVKRFKGGSLKDAVPCMVLLDMVGHKDLAITQDTASNQVLIKLFQQAIDQLSYGSKFFQDKNHMTDDHVPFLNYGVRAIDLIQFGDVTAWWHTGNDTMDLISPESLAIVGHVVSVALPLVAAEFYKKQ